MNAIILAGGNGVRLRPLTDNIPKPLLAVANRPILDYCVSHLYHHGIRDMVFGLGYLKEQIVEWATGYAGIATHFSVENSPLGTLGCVKAASEYLDDNFIVISGDGISDINLNAMLDTHIKTKAELTCAVTMHQEPKLYGVAQLNDDGFIDSFIEKPHKIAHKAYINCGVYIVSKKVLGYVDMQKCDFAQDLFPVLIKRRKLAYFRHQGYWADIGDLKSYYESNFDMINGGFYPFLRNFNHDKHQSHFLGGARPSLVADSAEIYGEIENCIVGRNSKVSALSILNNCIVADDSDAKGEHFSELIYKGETIFKSDINIENFVIGGLQPAIR